MIFQAAGIGLPDVAKIADAQSDATQAEIHRQELAKAQSISRMGTDNIVPYPILRNLIIALAKLWTEHQAKHWKVCLIGCSHR